MQGLRSSDNTKHSSYYDSLFDELITECRQCPPGARLSYMLRNKLENLTVDERRKVVVRKSEDSAPLFIACKRGNTEIVEYLIEVCGADVEQRGRYEVPDHNSVHVVSPLWCAAVAGKLSVVKCLVVHGADINSVSDTGSTAVRSACFMTHYDIVVYLAEHNADILKPNYNGGTCLINSVQSVPLCKFLLRHGAAVNAQDIQQKTALHYAIQEHRLETTKLLITHGANIWIKSRYGDDALMTACLKGSIPIMEHLIQMNLYSARRIVESYEVVGATFLDEHHDVTTALYYWRKATRMRIENSSIPPKVIREPRETFQYISEASSLEQLEEMIDDINALRMQALLIFERILGPLHKDFIYRLMYRGATYADSLQYNNCIQLWQFAVFLRISKDRILHNETCFTVQSLTRIMLDLQEKEQANENFQALKFSDVFHLMRMIVEELEYAMEVLNIRPVFERHRINFNGTMKVLTHLVFVLFHVRKTVDEDIMMKRLVNNLIHIDPRMSYGDSLLHLVVSRHRLSNTFSSGFLVANVRNNIFPCLELAQLFIECGIDPNVVNNFGCTPLLVACKNMNFNHEIVNLLLSNNGHIDQCDHNRVSPLSKIRNLESSKIQPLRYLTLRCLAASALKRFKIPYRGFVHSQLEKFVDVH